jgi:DNA-binding ferritin-like protein
MKNIAIALRKAQFLAHAGHNLISGPTFIQDHKFLGKLYPAYEESYDSIIERMIGLGESVDPLQLTEDAITSVNAKDVKQDPKSIYDGLLDIEREIQEEISDYLSDGVSHGTSNLLEGLADESEARIYIFRQSIK